MLISFTFFVANQKFLRVDAWRFLACSLRRLSCSRKTIAENLVCAFAHRLCRCGCFWNYPHLKMGVVSTKLESFELGGVLDRILPSDEKIYSWRSFYRTAWPDYMRDDCQIMPAFLSKSEDSYWPDNASNLPCRNDTSLEEDSFFKSAKQKSRRWIYWLRRQ